MSSEESQECIISIYMSLMFPPTKGVGNQNLRKLNGAGGEIVHVSYLVVHIHLNALSNRPSHL